MAKLLWLDAVAHPAVSLGRGLSLSPCARWVQFARSRVAYVSRVRACRARFGLVRLVTSVRFPCATRWKTVSSHLPWRH